MTQEGGTNQRRRGFFSERGVTALIILAFTGIAIVAATGYIKAHQPPRFSPCTVQFEDGKAYHLRCRVEGDASREFIIYAMPGREGEP